MKNSNILEKTISTNELYTQYSWFNSTFLPVLQDSFNDFFDNNFRVEFIGLSKNINCLLDNESCFVTKIKMNPEYDIFIRLTENAVSVILDKILGKSKSKFDLNKISNLETKIITSFGSYLYNNLKQMMKEPDPRELKRNDFNMINLTFMIKDISLEESIAGKIVVTLPQSLLEPEVITSQSEKFSKSDFPSSVVDVKILVGSTKFSLYDIKHLDPEDVVVFDNSNIEKLTLVLNDKKLKIKMNPNMGLILPQETGMEGDTGMADSDKDIWDSIEVDMDAEFDSVKITLGELKNIEDGLVVDLTSLYDNNVTLKVEGKPIAKGSLVIVNDRYGVKISEVIAGEGASDEEKSNENYDESEQDEYNEEEQYDNSSDEEEYEQEEEESEENSEQEDDDFDYSDFEVEEEDI